MDSVRGYLGLILEFEHKKPEYTSFEFLSDVGGTAGLVLGLSAASLISIGEDLFRVIYEKCRFKYVTKIYYLETLSPTHFSESFARVGMPEEIHLTRYKTPSTLPIFVIKTPKISVQETQVQPRLKLVIFTILRGTFCFVAYGHE